MFKRVHQQKSSSLLGMLSCLTVLFIAAQLSLFIIHYKVSTLIDSLVNTSIVLQLLHPVILLPVFAFIAIQILAYVLFVGWIWSISLSVGRLFHFSKPATFWLGVLMWFAACAAMLSLNKYYFPDSFFAHQVSQLAIFAKHNQFVLWATLIPLCIATLIAYGYYFLKGAHRVIGSVLLLGMLSIALTSLYQALPSRAHFVAQQPNVIIIGLDSLRPDFTGFYGKKDIRTPNIDQFLSGAQVFNQAYTPLARTFPSWISILTAKYPKHSFARNNLVDPTNIVTEDTLARHLQQAGYETIYATDEKRFSNVTEWYGFDRVLGPRMGVNDFLLGGLADFPMSNLLVNLSVGEWLFPFNYANRAAAITYEPKTFLQLVKHGLSRRSEKPLFLSVHFCLSHWPFRWARDELKNGYYLPNQYRNSVQGVDQQLGALLKILQDQRLLENSLVVLLSDHGTALGMRGDRILSKERYVGDPEKIKSIPTARLSSASANSVDFKRDYTINTAYGQGTNVLSLTQSHVLLAFKRFGKEWAPRQDTQVSSLLDVAPTILDYLNLAPLKAVDGLSLRTHLNAAADLPLMPRALFMETGDSMTEIETDHIYVEKVLKKQIGIYSIHPQSGLLTMNPPAEKSLIHNKQLAVLANGWILARYPARLESKLVPVNAKGQPMKFKKNIIPPYYVLANVNSGQWTLDLSSPFARKSPVAELQRQLRTFYGEEL